MERLITTARFNVVQVINALAKECYETMAERQASSFAYTERALKVLKDLVNKVDFAQLHHYVVQSNPSIIEFVEFAEFIQHYNSVKSPQGLNFIVRHNDNFASARAFHITANYHEVKRTWGIFKNKKKYQKTFYLDQPFRLLFQFFIAYSLKGLPRQLIINKQLYGQDVLLKELAYRSEKISDSILKGEGK